MTTKTSQERKSYSELCKLQTFEERYEYLKDDSHKVGEQTFGGQRWLNQKFYTSKEWRHFRRDIILRDNGCDMGLDGFDINDKVVIHHINPITYQDVHQYAQALMDPENSICVSDRTHRAIHYGDEPPIDKIIERRPGDTCPWRHI